MLQGNNSLNMVWTTTTTRKVDNGLIWNKNCHYVYGHNPVVKALCTAVVTVVFAPQKWGEKEVLSPFESIARGDGKSAVCSMLVISRPDSSICSSSEGNHRRNHSVQVAMLFGTLAATPAWGPGREYNSRQQLEPDFASQAVLFDVEANLHFISCVHSLSGEELC